MIDPRKIVGPQPQPIIPQELREKDASEKTGEMAGKRTVKEAGRAEATPSTKLTAEVGKEKIATPEREKVVAPEAVKSEAVKPEPAKEFVKKTSNKTLLEIAEFRFMSDKKKAAEYLQLLAVNDARIRSDENAKEIIRNNTLEWAKYAGPDVSHIEIPPSFTDEQFIAVMKSCPNIRYMRIDGCNNLSEAALIKHLPKGKKIKLHFGSNALISKRIFKDLPKDLRYLHWGSGSLTGDDFKNLPPFLKVLEGDCDCSNITDDAIRLLPPGLISLALGDCPKLTNEGVKLLPRELGTFSIGKTVHLTNAAIKYLPESLVSLTLGESEWLSREGIKNIPKGVTIFRLINCDHLEDIDFADLPRTVRYMDLINSCRNLSEDLIKNLPKGEARS